MFEFIREIACSFRRSCCQNNILNKELSSLLLHRVLLVKGKVCKVFCGVGGIPKIVKAQASNSFPHTLSLSTGTEILIKNRS